MKTGGKRTGFGILICLTLIGSAACGRPSGKNRIKKPVNLVIIVSDALRRDVLGCYGGETRTPNIDRLAREGTVFENAYSTAPCTLPSSVAMLTGNYSRTFFYQSRKRKEIRDNLSPREYFFLVPDKYELLGEKFHAREYATGASVENEVVLRSNILQGMNILGRGLVEGIVDAVSPGPFFLIKWFMDPHGPYSPPGKYLNKLEVNWDRLPRKRDIYTSYIGGDWNRLIKAGELSLQELDVVKALYRAEVEWMDERLGRILARLEATGALENTVIVFTSDHGEMLGGHGKIGHGKAFWQPLLRVPLIFFGPGIPSGKRVAQIVTLLDLVPTLLELFDLDGREQLQGESFGAVFRGHSLKGRSPFFDAASNNLGSKWAHTCALLHEGFKLVVNPSGKQGDMLLFHSEKDIRETRDLSQTEEGKVSILYHLLLQQRNRNLLKRQKNRSMLRRDRNLDDHQRRTEETLRSLGYL